MKHVLYFTPSIDYAALYAPPFKMEGKFLQVVFQCRVNLNHIKGKVPATGGAEDEKKFKDQHFDFGARMVRGNLFSHVLIDVLVFQVDGAIKESVFG